MAIVSRKSASNWIFLLKVLLISTGVCSLAVVLKLYFPVISTFLISKFPLFWSSLRSWLRPPYLYVVINCIIITIAASSRFHQKVEEQQPEPIVPVPVPVKAEVQHDFTDSSEYEALLLKNPVNLPQNFDYDSVAAAKDLEEKADVYGQSMVSVAEVTDPVMNASEEDDEYGFVVSRSNWTPQARNSTEIPADCSFPTEKPLVSVRFGHRKNVKSSPEAGRSLGVAKWKRNDTLENTWKTITDGRPIPLARHLKKSETWETGPGHYNIPNSDQAKMKKSETFIKDRNSNISALSPSSGLGKLRRDPSLGQDELNRRVEAFINKFNEEMKLQRQESLNQYHEMIKRGAGP
ncbi:hypothetical protein NE237_031153 [Protea cynaroides]|uniref:DUF4408 domain-containing protein n=1 Tax=Protea cynaroides TaxID=273540 RepID=A0A9Q0L1W4_9MAGN|nr:hypothetical protein NE237_031153 [Protea cynaroides]